MKTSINPGEIVIPHDFIDFTKSRTLSFFDNKRIHVDMSAPFCPHLREILHQSCKSNSNVIFHSKGIYLTTEGPRLETPAEILFFSTIGDVVGMTIGQETILAREKGICYAALCVVCNMAAGLQHQLTAQEITRIYKEKEPLVAQILTSAFSKMTNKKTCLCGYTLHGA
jgi:5'-methylthioadenosine phosphorylase